MIIMDVKIGGQIMAVITTDNNKKIGSKTA